MDDTIVAVATGPGAGAIGVVRLSGPAALQIFDSIWRGEVPAADLEVGQVHVGLVGRRGEEPIDQVVAFFMRAPHSYTGEDVVEIQAHGGIRLLEMIVEQLIAGGARPAGPGEFTQRAFLNGKLDLAQAEAVADLIAASSDRAVRQAGRQLSGALSEAVEKLRNDLKVMRAQMEAMIDFPEDEDVQGLRPDEIVERVAEVERRILGLIDSYREGRAFREGVRVAIVGKPNVGKSSLLNALLGEDRAIVHPTPGTTRDTVEEVLEIGGLPVRLIDTAGIRRGEGEIEGLGIRRTQARIEKADLVLVLLDSTRPFDREDDEVFEAVGARERLILINKTDLSGVITASALSERIGDDRTKTIRISALTGAGLSEVKETIRRSFVSDPGGRESEVVLTNVRHRVALEKGLGPLKKTRESAAAGASLEFLVADLAPAMEALEEVTGSITTDEILGEIFSKFCIGK